MLDHVIALNEIHLNRLLADYFHYYHEDRTHLGLRKETPDGQNSIAGLRSHYCSCATRRSAPSLRPRSVNSPQLDYWHALVTDLLSSFLVMSWLGSNYPEKKFHNPIETVSTAFTKFAISPFMGLLIFGE
jgi:hypothetical protein